MTAQLGNRANLSDVCIFQGEVERHRGNLALAENAYRESLHIAEDLQSSWAAAARTNLALIRLELGIYGEARVMFERAHKEFEEAGRQSVGQIVQTFLMTTYAAQGDWATWQARWPSIANFEHGHTYADKDSGRFLVQAAELAKTAGQFRFARDAGQLAAEHYRSIGQEREAQLLVERYTSHGASREQH